MKTILNVEGMSCPSCVDHVKDALALEGVTTVDVRIREKAAVIDHDPRVTTGRLIAALEQAGYEAAPSTVTANVTCNCASHTARR